MTKRKKPLDAETIEKIIKRHKEAYKRLAKQEVCDGCGCTPCDCGWGHD